MNEPLSDHAWWDLAFQTITAEPMFTPTQADIREAIDNIILKAMGVPKMLTESYEQGKH